MGIKILVVDDDEPLAEMIGIVLDSGGYENRCCYNGGRALEAFRSFQPNLVLLDLMLPEKDGVQVCREIRNESSVPIIMLTAKTDTTDVVAGLEAGADDYVSKPFKPKELLARIKARLRGQGEYENEDVQLGNLLIKASAHEVLRDGKAIMLTPIEFDLLYTMAKSPWKAFTRAELLEQIWAYREGNTDTRLINVHIQRLRGKIEADPENPAIIRTVRGVGYRAFGEA